MQTGANIAQYSSLFVMVLVILAIIIVWKEKWIIGMAFRNFKRKKVRNTLTVIGIIFSVAMLVGFNIARQNVTNTFYNTIELATGKLDLEISRADGEPFPEDLTDLLDDIEGIEAYAPRIQRYCVIYVHKSWNSTMATVIGIDPTIDRAFGDIFDLNGSNPINHLVTGDNAIVSESLMDGISGEQDEKIVNASIGNKLNIKYYHDPPSSRTRGFNIAAFAEGKGKIAQVGYGRVVIVTLDSARLLTKTWRKIDKIIINLTEESRTDYKTVIANIEDKFGKDFRVDAVRESLLAVAEGAVSGFDTSLNWAGLITLLASVFLVFNSIVMTVTERRYELGIMRAIGMSKLQVFRLILYEVIILGGIGSLVGSFGGVLVAHAITSYVSNTTVYGFRVMVESVELDPSVMFTGFIMGFSFAVGGALFPLGSVATMKVVTALHGDSHEAEKRKISRGLLVGGIILALVGFGLLFITPSIPAANLSDFLSIVLLLCITGISITVAKYNRKAASLVAGIGLTATGALITITAISYMSEILLLIGSIILCGSLLNIVSRGFYRLLNSIPAFRTVAKIASRNLTRRPLRSTLTFGIFTIAISLSILFASINTAVTIGVTHYIEEGLNMDIIVTTNTGAPPNLAGNLSRIEGVYWTNDTPTEEWRPGVSVAELTGAKFEIWDQEETSLLVAVNSSTYPLAIEQDLIEPDPNVTDTLTLFDQLGGTGDNKCIISDRLADELKVKVGQKTKLEISAHGNSTEFTIIGIVRNDLIGYPSGGYFCIIDLEKYYDFGFDDDVHIFYVKLRNQHWNGTVVDQDKVAQKILDLYGDEYNLSIIKTKDIVDEWRVNVGETTQFMATLSSSSIIIALLCLATTMIRIVQERQREIGLLRSVGYYRSEIIKLLLGESLLLAVLGLSVGIINGYILAASYLPHFKEIGFTPYEVEFVFPLLQTITVAILGLVVAVVGTVFPAYKALRMSPAQAVRYTG